MTEHKSGKSSADKMRRSRKRRELALILPLCGVIAFASPVLDMFTGSSVGLGGKIAYIFGCWIGLILIGYLLSRLLRPEVGNK